MSHYEIATVPVPALKVVILLAPDVLVLAVKPPPILAEKLLG
jgi:hypothetical protein